MITRREYNHLLWVDVESPTREEVLQLMEEFEIHPVIADELLSPSLRPKVDRYENCLYLILHFPALSHNNTRNGRQEVDFIIGKKFLVTVHYETVDPVHRFGKIFEVNSVLERGEMGSHAGFLFFSLIKKLYGSLTHELGYLSDLLKNSEEQIFAEEEEKMVAQLSLINRDLINFRQGLRLHRGVLESLELVGKDFFGKTFEPYLANISGEYHKVNELMEDLKDTANDLRQTNDSLLTSKTNQVIRVLTVISFIMLSANMAAQIFIVPAENVPLIGHALDFWLILLIVAIAGIAPFWYFKTKKWL